MGNSACMLTDAEREAMIDRATRALYQSNRPVKFELDMTLTVGLIGQLQLAFRHPDNTGPTRQMLESFVRELIEKIDPAKGDAYRFLMMGFDYRYEAEI